MGGNLSTSIAAPELWKIGVNLSWGRSEGSARFPGAGQRRTAGEAAALKVGLSSGFTTKSFQFGPWGFVKSVQTGIWKNTLKSSGVAGDNHAGPDKPARVCCPGTVPWDCVEVPHPQLIFHPVKYNTHTHTHCVNAIFLATDPAG